MLLIMFVQMRLDAQRAAEEAQSTQAKLEAGFDPQF